MSAPRKQSLIRRRVRRGVRPSWVSRRPATTLRTSAEVTAPTYRDRDPGWRPGMPAPSQATNAVRVNVEEAATLQGFPEGYPWQGARTRQFKQVGNAVPPPLAHRVLEQAVKPSWPRPGVRR
ncbi:MAG: DNA cytosine methyltransferase [Solirubrobacteraceae bacterium]